LGFGKSEIFFARGLDRGIKKQPVGQISRPSCGVARVAKPYPKDLPPSLRGALLSAEARLRAKADATKQSIARRARLWIASLIGRRLAPSRWLAMTVANMIGASK
jgi:hypothetical protein